MFKTQFFLNRIAQNNSRTQNGISNPNLYKLTTKISLFIYLLLFRPNSSGLNFIENYLVHKKPTFLLNQQIILTPCYPKRQKIIIFA